MRIAFVSYELPPDLGKGGIGTYTLQAAQAVQKAGNDVVIFCATPVRDCSEYEDNIRIERILCSSPVEFTKLLTESFTALHVAQPFDLVECPEIHGNAIGLKEKFPSLPLVVRLHGPNRLVESLKKNYTSELTKWRFEFGSLRRGKYRKWDSYKKTEDPDYTIACIADLITAPCLDIKIWVMEHWQIQENKIAVLPNIFIPPAGLVSNDVKNNEAVNTVLFFGRLNVLKGLVNFTRAVVQFKKKFPGWKICIIGDDGPGPFQQKSMKQWMRNKLEGVTQIEFLPGMPPNELYQQINAADIVVLPSLFETFSYTCAEAMAAGKAIIGSKEGGMKELLDDGAGICIDPYKFKEISSALTLLTSDAQLRKTIGYKAFDKIHSKKYNSDVVTEMLKNYKNLLH